MQKIIFKIESTPTFTTPHHHIQTDIFNQFIESESEKNDIFIFLFIFIHTHEIKHDIQYNHGKTDFPYNLTHIPKPNLQYYSTRVEKKRISIEIHRKCTRYHHTKKESLQHKPYTIDFHFRMYSIFSILIHHSTPNI